MQFSWEKTQTSFIAERKKAANRKEIEKGNNRHAVMRRNDLSNKENMKNPNIVHRKYSKRQRNMNPQKTERRQAGHETEQDVDDDKNETENRGRGRRYLKFFEELPQNRVSSTSS